MCSQVEVEDAERTTESISLLKLDDATVNTSCVISYMRTHAHDCEAVLANILLIRSKGPVRALCDQRDPEVEGCRRLLGSCFTCS